MEKIITLLYVDDEPINLEIFENTFKDKYIILTAESGEEGLDLIKRNHQINVVISDMSMPIMSGIEFISEAKKENNDILYFILTGYEITEEIQNALEQKIINKYFRKPFESTEIEHAIDSVF